MAHNLDEISSIVNQTPFYVTVGMELCGFEEGCSIVRLKTDQRHENLLGTVHGGAIASLVDTSCGLALALHMTENDVMITSSLHVDYMASVKKGDLVGRGKVIHMGKKLVRVEAVISDEEGKLIAKGYATLTRTASHSFRHKKGSTALP
jgi:acyl-CoA thioesterase